MLFFRKFKMIMWSLFQRFLKLHLANFKRIRPIRYTWWIKSKIFSRHIYLQVKSENYKKTPLMLTETNNSKAHTLSKRNSGFTKSNKYMVSGARSQSAMDLWVEVSVRVTAQERASKSRISRLVSNHFSPLHKWSTLLHNALQ